MPYCTKFILFLFAANMVVFFGAYRLREFNPVVLAVFIACGILEGGAIIGNQKMEIKRQVGRGGETATIIVSIFMRS